MHPDPVIGDWQLAPYGAACLMRRLTPAKMLRLPALCDPEQRRHSGRSVAS